MLRFVSALLGVFALLAGARVEATDGDGLRLLMLSAQDMNTPQTLVRADVAISVEAPQGKRTTTAIALFAPGKDARWYWQQREPALRALVVGADRKVLEQQGSTTDTVPIGAPLDTLGIAYEDLSRFIVDDFKTQQITDEATDHILVGMHPAVDSAYVYRAYTFDKEKTVPTKIQFYAKTLSNMVKLRLDADHILIGKKWMPTTIDIQNYPDNTTTHLKIKWTPNATAPPELLVASSFPATSPLPWESAPKATATPGLGK
jgi:hypothetical protein